MDEILRSAILWDGGVARRSWTRNEHSIETIIEFNRNYKEKAHVTIPYIPTDELIDKVVAAFFNSKGQSAKGEIFCIGKAAVDPY